MSNKYIINFPLGATDPLNPPAFLKNLQDLDWNPIDLTQIVSFLEKGKGLTASGGPSICSYCGKKIGSGISWRTDGQFMWRVELAHLVQHHHYKIPDELIARIRAFNYEPPVTHPDDMERTISNVDSHRPADKPRGQSRHRD